MKTILYLSTSSGPGGAERVISDLAASVDRQSFRPIVCLFRPGWLQERCESRGVETHIFPMTGMTDWRWVYKLLRFIRQERIRLIHAHEFDANVHGTLVAYLAGIPCVATVHGKHYYWTKLRRRIAYWLVARCASMVAVSQDLREFISEKVGIESGRIKVIYNGVTAVPDSSKAEIEDCRRELGIPGSDRVVGVVGSLYPVKGHRFLLDAVPQVLQRVPNTTFLIIGRGELEMALKEQVQRLGVAKKVLFLGLRQDIPRLLAVLDVFALPSLSEGLSMAILEAMMAAKPVVATRVGGNHEIVVHDKTGLLVSSNDAEALSREITKLLEDKSLRKRMGKAGRMRAEECFSLQMMVSEYQALYLSCLSKASSGETSHVTVQCDS